jgi:hypothetical protein
LIVGYEEGNASTSGAEMRASRFGSTFSIDGGEMKLLEFIFVSVNSRQREEGGLAGRARSAKVRVMQLGFGHGGIGR